MAKPNPYYEKSIAPLISAQTYAKQAYSLPLISTQAQWENLQKSLAATHLTVKMVPSAAVDVKSGFSPPALSSGEFSMLMDESPLTKLDERWFNLFRLIESVESKTRYVDVTVYPKSGKPYLQKTMRYGWGHQGTKLEPVYYKFASSLIQTIQAFPATVRKEAFTALIACFPPIANQYLSNKPWSTSLEEQYAKSYSVYGRFGSTDASSLMTLLVNQTRGDWNSWDREPVKFDKDMSSWGNYGNTWFERILSNFSYILQFIPNETIQRRFARQIENCFIQNYLLVKIPESGLETIESKFSAAAENPTIGGGSSATNRHPNPYRFLPSSHNPTVGPHPRQFLPRSYNPTIVRGHPHPRVYNPTIVRGYVATHHPYRFLPT